VFGINGGEFIILAIIAVIVVGPERLPQYASQLARLVRELKRLATGAREQLKEEAGVDLDGVDWRKLDPRQYDPRRIIRDALLDDEPAGKPVSPGGPATMAAGGAAAAGAAAAGGAGATDSSAATATPAAAAETDSAGVSPQPVAARQAETSVAVVPGAGPRLAAGQLAPYDVEAT